MGNLCGKKTPREVRKHELAFMGLVSDGVYNDPGQLDAVLKDAKEDNKEDQIFNARDEEKDLPIHKAALHGNPTCLKWIIETWKSHDIPLNIDEKDHNGRTALFLVCYKGYLGAEAL